MNPVLFYGVPHGCSFGSIVALEWLGRPYNLVRIDMLAPHDPRFAAVNPLHETPALLTGEGRPVTESLAVLHHIGALDFGKELVFRQGSVEFDRLNQALAFLHTSLHPAFAPAWAAYKLADGAAEKPLLREFARSHVAKALSRLDAVLAGRAWLAGPARTVADAYLYGVARWATDLALLDIKAYPELHRHLERLAADPAVQFAHAIEDGTPATGAGGFEGHLSLAETGRLKAA